MMERIRLSEDEKKVLRLVNDGKRRPRGYPPSRYIKAISTLEEKGLVSAAWTAVGAVSGLLALVVSLVALFVACGNIN